MPLTLKKVKVAALVVLLAGHEEEEEEEKTRPRTKKRFWMTPHLRNREKHTKEVLLKKLKDNNYEFFLGMDEECFNRLFELCKPFIETKKDTHLRKSISQKERLMATLVYLSSGKSMKKLPDSVAISTMSLTRIIPATCSSIIQALKDVYMKLPSTEEDWKMISKDFKEKWEFPNCVGAIGGRHIRMLRHSSDDGTRYLNYKNFNSVIMIAVVNANLEFLTVDVGMDGSLSGQQALENTEFYARLQEKALNLPSRKKNANGLNSVFIGEEAFDLQENLLTPFTLTELSEERSVFNYRLSRARQCVENTFRILSGRFKVLQTQFSLQIPTIEKIVQASCLLHNFMMRECKEKYSMDFQVDEDLEYGDSIVFGSKVTESDAVEEVLIPLEKGVQKRSEAAEDARNEYVHFFNNVASYYPE